MDVDQGAVVDGNLHELHVVSLDAVQRIFESSKTDRSSVDDGQLILEEVE